MKTLTLFKHQAGIGLVEIMIASVIGLFLMGGLMQMFVTSKQTYKLQDTLSRVQENGRFGMDFLSRDIRATDSWGCFNDRSSVENLLTSTGVFTTFNTGIAGEDNHVSTGSTDKVLANTDTLSIIGNTLLQDTSGSDVVVTAIDSSPTGQDPLTISVTDTSALGAGDIVYLSDCDQGSVFMITSIDNAAGGVTHDATTVIRNVSNSSDTFATSYRVGSNLYKVLFATYDIRQGERGDPTLFDEPSLYRTIPTENNGVAQELVEGVENMQILYGEDTDDDGTPNYYVTANNVADMNKVVSLKVSLVVRSLDNNLTGVPVAYTLNGVSITPTDTRIRRVFSYVIAIRNRLV